MEPWSERARSWVSEQQERAYGEFGQDLGFGWNPKKAHESFSTPPAAKDDFRLSIDRFKQVLGPDYLSAAEWREAAKGWEEYKREHYYVEPPTAYEEWNI